MKIKHQYLNKAVIGLVVSGALFSGGALAEYPEKPIQMLVAFAPGGGTDIAARSVAHYLEKHLAKNASVAVINKPGAGGEIGWTALARAKPDGYTIGMINPPATNALVVEGKAKYTMDDFQPIANLVYDPGILVVNQQSPYQTLAQLIDAARQTPDKLVIGTSGAAGSSEHVAILNLNRQAGIRFKTAFFGSTAPVRQAVLGNHVPAATMNLSEALPLVREGQIRILGVMAEQRSPWLKDAPTFREQHIDLVAGASRGIAAPKGTPPEIVARLEKALHDVINDPEYLAAAQKAEIPLNYLDAQGYGKLIQRVNGDLAETWKITPWR
ncbi:MULTISPECIES: tripartite tricarboxylate transporter substrate binding protein [unclassified Brenneria]|uniref:tripartite tricarboxylate transporter substrate binding protein n=1 Tax=unclassified Brenneria TaxID=2634434 RepID=UPI0029C40F83|nr:MULTISPECIES: tripartite tricarboxylate transporter substrate binding protein [unclassified Brenneria]MDX5627522.1 tripartite tricarboxylate transporter substrate binding protein [Brenneria sp. L3-3Z]MDX5694322.1 tripartite tricarboxylate transporter substrate binding protein [Brenneria sp. L4-2C]MEE3662094.1 tripartite tricarboxylate transporter substrate binding protein [Brenneria sp. g21c3]